MGSAFVGDRGTRFFFFFYALPAAPYGVAGRGRSTGGVPRPSRLRNSIIFTSTESGLHSRGSRRVIGRALAKQVFDHISFLAFSAEGTGGQADPVQCGTNQRVVATLELR